MNVLKTVEAQGTSDMKAISDPRLEIAKKLEKAFISEMLSFMSMKTPTEFGGGIGEDQFQSFLREQHASLISDAGGLGLVEHFMNGLEEK